MAKKIELSNGFQVIVDDEDYEFLSRFQWQASYASGHWYATCGELRMHRLVAGVGDRRTRVDHKNRDGLDNRKENVRVATMSQNQMNQKRREDNTTGFKGVHIHNGKYVARIGINGQRHFLGGFDDVFKAAEAYDEKARELFGEFARVNFPREGERGVRDE